MHIKTIIQAVAAEQAGDMLTPYAIAIALQVATDKWAEKETAKYGTVFRDLIFRLGNEARSL